MAERPLGTLQRLERFLAVRLVYLERQLPVDGSDSAHWAEYVQAADTLVRIRGQLYPPASGSAGGGGPTRRRPPAA
jgi:hypothetical protein